MPAPIWVVLFLSLSIHFVAGNSCGGLLKGEHGPPVTEPPVTKPPVPTATGLFAATEAGLIALNLQTLETTALTSDATYAVAVNQKLEKVYWSEFKGNYSILRSNFDGSAQETIVSQTGDIIWMMAIDEASGNVYYALYNSPQITVCNALGSNFSAVISNSSLVSHPIGIALDSENGFMYWGNLDLETIESFLVRANLDGSNATIISTAFGGLNGITLEQPSNTVLYWVDFMEHAVGTIDVNGGNKRTLVELERYSNPFGMQVDAEKIYFSSDSGQNIQSVDRGSGKELVIIFNSTGPLNHLTLFNAPVKQY